MNSNIENALSKKARRVDFPALSVLEQNTKNMGIKVNAGVGVTTDGANYLGSSLITKKFLIDDPLRYTQCYGLDSLRKQYQERISKQNNLDQSYFSLPVITNGITHALNIAGQMFVDEGDIVIMPDLHWENYEMIYEKILGGRIKLFESFTETGLNIDALKECLENHINEERVVLLFNFPNNPTGYMPEFSELEKIADYLCRFSIDRQKFLPVIIDEAGYGFFYNSGICKESLFSFLVKRSFKTNAPLIPVLAKGSTKEDLAYGLRVASITIGGKFEKSFLVQKIGGLVRGTLSAVCTTSQKAVSESIDQKDHELEIEQISKQMLNRHQHIINVAIPLAREKRNFDQYFYMYPCNSGFFITFRTSIPAESLLEKAREKDIAFTIFNENHIRIGFSSLRKEDTIEFMLKLCESAREL